MAQTSGFPFRLSKDRQPDQHGGFDLYCNDKDDTVLELSTSVKAFVKNIDYKSQSIEVTDLDGCFPRKIRGLKLNLSSSPFRFNGAEYILYNYSPIPFSIVRQKQFHNFLISIVLVAVATEFMLFVRMMTSTTCPYYHVQRCIAFRQFQFILLFFNWHGPDRSADTVKWKAIT